MSREENRDSFYPPVRDYQESEKGIDQLIRSVYGDLSPEDMADVKAQPETAPGLPWGSSG